MSVHPALMTVMSKLSVITLKDPLIAHVAPDTLEMEHHAPVNHHVQCNNNHNYNEVRDRSTPQCFCIHITFIQRPVCKSIRAFLLSIQTSTSVRPTPITVMSKLSVITLKDPLIAHVAPDTLEMEHHAPVNHHVQCNNNHNYNEVRDRSTPQCFCIHITFIQRPVCKSIRTFLLSIQTSTSVRPTPIIVMSKLSVITLRDRLIAHATLDTLEME